MLTLGLSLKAGTAGGEIQSREPFGIDGWIVDDFELLVSVIFAPHLDVISNADDDALAVQVGVGAQEGRDVQTALLVERRVARAGKSEAEERAVVGVGGAESFGAHGEALEGFGSIDEEIFLEAARDDGASRQILAEFRGDGQPTLVVNCVGELTHEHKFYISIN